MLHNGMVVSVNIRLSHDVVVLSCDPCHRPIVRRIIGVGMNRREAVYDVLSRVLCERPRQQGPPIFISCGRENLLLGNIVISDPEMGLPTYVKVGIRNNGQSVVVGSQRSHYFAPGSRSIYRLVEDHYEEI